MRNYYRGGVEIELEDLTPEFFAMIAEEFQSRLDSLDDEGLRQIAIAKMEGYTDDEVATRIGFSRRYVRASSPRSDRPGAMTGPEVGTSRR